MHGTIPQLPVAAHRRRRKLAVLKTIAIAVVVGILTAAAIYEGYGVLNATERGHNLLIKWGFEYPPDCS
jgi:hypothetical protein